ncbi:MAG: erythromycin esterase family protein [Bacteroidota bacterium]
MIRTTGQNLSADAQQYLFEHAFHIPEDSKNTISKWQPVLEQVKDKRIVLIGEFSHGAREVFTLRNELIRELHEKLGFDVVLFEAGIGELIHLNEHKKEYTPGELTDGFYGIWRNKEFRELMKYIKSRDIHIAGFDIQKSGRTFDRFLQFESKKNRDADSLYIANIENRFNTLDQKVSSSNAVYDSLVGPIQTLITDYEVLSKSWDKVKDEQKDNSALWIQRTIINRIEYLKYRLDFAKDRDWRKRWTARDREMASNVEWLLEHFFKDKKVIIIGHNFHTAKFNEKEEVMGEFLHRKRGNEMYTIATFASKGTYHDNNGKVREMKQPSEEQLDIKHIINILNGKVHFVVMPQKQKKENDWLFKEIVVNDSFIDLNSSNTLTLSNSFDGMILINAVTPPTK